MSCNDIPSLLDLQKAKLNADDFGRLMGTGTGTSTNGVTGQVRPTYNKVINDMNSEFDGMIVDMNSEFDQQIQNLGYTRVGTFAAGGTLLNGRQTLLWDIANGGDGQEYGWSGSFPPSGKVVPPGSTPLTTGGIAAGAWMSRFDPALRVQTREALRRSYAEAGYNLVDGSFEAGGTLVNTNDVLLQERTGKVFSGPAGVVAAGTNPTGGGFVDKSGGLLRHELATSDGAAKVGTSGANGGSVQDFIDNSDQVHRRVTTVAAVEAGNFKVGDKLELTDRAGAKFNVVAGGTPNGEGVIDAGNGNTAVVQVENNINVTAFGGATIAQSINRALAHVRRRLKVAPWTITVPQNPDGGAYDWDEQVDLSDDSWITLKGDGYVAIKATSQMNAFFILGIGNKNNATELSHFSCDCGNFVMEAAVITGSIRGVDIHNIELKSTGTGSYTDGILIGGDSRHTGSEPGAGNEQSTFTHIFDSGDSAVTRDVIHFQGGTSLGVLVDNIRATGDNFVNVVGSRNDSGFTGCDIRNIHAIMLTERTIKANSLVNLKASVTATKVSNLQVTGNPNVDNVNYGLLVDDLNAKVSSSLHAENLGVGYIIDDVSVPSSVVRAHINGVSFNNGDPNSQGVISATPVVAEKGGVIWDSVNKTVFIGGDGNTDKQYETAMLKRRVQIANNGVFKYTYPAGDYRLTGAILSVVPEMSSGAQREGLVSLRATGTAAANKLTNGAGFDVTTGALNGTTGVAGNVTVSADSSDGSLYFENRTGAARTFMITWLS